MEKNLKSRFGLQVDLDRCNACQTCLDVCPDEALELEDGFPVLTRFCQNCGACEAVCPNHALAMEFTIR